MHHTESQNGEAPKPTFQSNPVKKRWNQHLANNKNYPSEDPKQGKHMDLVLILIGFAGFSIRMGWKWVRINGKGYTNTTYISEFHPYIPKPRFRTHDFFIFAFWCPDGMVWWVRFYGRMGEACLRVARGTDHNPPTSWSVEHVRFSSLQQPACSKPPAAASQPSQPASQPTLHPGIEASGLQASMSPISSRGASNPSSSVPTCRHPAAQALKLSGPRGQLNMP